MALKPEISVGAGLALATLVYAIHQNATPPIADIRTLPEGNPDISRATRSASWMAAGAVALVSLIAHDRVLFIYGGSMVIGMDLWTRHANLVNPELKRFVPGGAIQSAPAPDMEEREYTIFDNQFESQFAAA